MATTPDPYLLDTDSRLKRMVTVKHGDTATQWIPRDQFEATLRELHDYRKALALVNVAVTVKDTRIHLDVRKILDSLGETVNQAVATGSIILSARNREKK